MVALHGFTLTGAQFAPVESRPLQLHAPDLPGHGRTRVDPVDVPTALSVLGHWLQSFNEPVPLLGYSQGGRLALLIALQYPDLVDRLILVSTSPGIRDETDREARRRRDEALAYRIETIGLDAFLDEWLEGSITGTSHLSDAVCRADRSIRTENTAAGLASALRGLGQGRQPFVGDRLSELEIPVLTISGRWDEAYERLAKMIATAAPNGRHISIPDAGHNVVLDAPKELAALVEEFCEVGDP
ncbi:MAG: alpha/beta fold hydrolase [Actinomycetota bacterium]|nr:alpha/beta fold hydrolase [Actinomycetota bacterium]